MGDGRGAADAEQDESEQAAASASLTTVTSGALMVPRPSPWSRASGVRRSTTGSRVDGLFADTVSGLRTSLGVYWAVGRRPASIASCIGIAVAVEAPSVAIVMPRPTVRVTRERNMEVEPFRL